MIVLNTDLLKSASDPPKHVLHLVLLGAARGILSASAPGEIQQPVAI